MNKPTFLIAATCVFLFTNQLMAQNKNTLTAGVYYPLLIGNNAANENFSDVVGFEMNYMRSLHNHFSVGGGYSNSFHSSDIVFTDGAGNDTDKSMMLILHHFNPMVGYEFLPGSKWNFGVSVSAGLALASLSAPEKISYNHPDVGFNVTPGIQLISQLSDHVKLLVSASYSYTSLHQNSTDLVVSPVSNTIHSLRFGPACSYSF